MSLDQFRFYGLASSYESKEPAKSFGEVSKFIFANIIPAPLKDYFLVIGFPAPLIFHKSPFALRVRPKNRPEHWAQNNFATFGIGVGKFKSDGQPFEINADQEKETSHDAVQPFDLSSLDANFLEALQGSYDLAAFACPPLVMLHPGFYEVVMIQGEDEHTLGEFTCVFRRSAPLSTDERHTLIEKTGSGVRLLFRIGCPHCKDTASYYHSIGNALTSPEDGAIPIEEAEDQWTCKCGRSVVALRYLREAVWYVYRKKFDEIEQKSLPTDTLIDIKKFDKLVSDYMTILEKNADKEEEVQKFLADHPELFSWLSYEKVIPKPPILTSFVADFAILSQRGTLYFVEIEKPSTPLVKNDKHRHQHHKLTQAFSQVSDWRDVIEKHRSAVLEEIGLNPDKVKRVLFIVVAGMSSTVELEELARIRKSCPPDTQFRCFDELPDNLRSIAVSSPP